MKFNAMEREYQFQSELQPHTIMVRCKAMTKMLIKERVAVMVQVTPIASFKAVEVVNLQI